MVLMVLSIYHLELQHSHSILMDISKRIIHLLQLQVERLHSLVRLQIDESQSSSVQEDSWWVVERYRLLDSVVQVLQHIHDQHREPHDLDDIMSWKLQHQQDESLDKMQEQEEQVEDEYDISDDSCKDIVEQVDEQVDDK